MQGGDSSGISESGGEKEVHFSFGEIPLVAQQAWRRERLNWIFPHLSVRSAGKRPSGMEINGLRLNGDCYLGFNQMQSP
jgi:hypothetical protein